MKIFAKWILGSALAFSLSTSAMAETFSFVAVGDTAYNGAHDYPAYDALIEKINKERPAFTVHVGDIWGASNCHDDHYTFIKSYFDKYKRPVIYTPGDNEWLDCAHPAMGGYEVGERLEHLRKVFFKKSKSLGAKPMTLVRQSDVSPYKTFVENARWAHKGVLFVTLNVPGDNNNFDYGDPDRLLEAEARNAANVAWLRDTMRHAMTENYKAVVIVFHAEILMNGIARDDTFYQVKNGPYGDLVRELQLSTDRFPGQILVIHGDSHEFIVDRPLLIMNGEDKPSDRANLTRLEVFGAPEVKAVKVMVDTESSGVFGFQPLY